MKDIGTIQGSAAQAIPLVIGKDTVYVHTDIQKINTNSEGTPTDNLYQYHEIQYGKDEYIQLMGNNLNAITPYTEKKTAYIGDTEITFSNMPSGNITVYFPYEYSLEKQYDRITITFEPLEEVTDITISIL
jgi:hypothetical protein